MARVVQSKADKEWEAENDFRSLTEAEEVKGDNARLARAKKAGKRLVVKEQKALKTKQRVAGTRKTPKR